MKDLTGQKFGRLTVLEKTDKRKSNGFVWLCKCDCGKEHEVPRGHLVRGGTRSCGCLHKENSVGRLKENNADSEFNRKRKQRSRESIQNKYTGKRVGMLVAVEPTDEVKDTKRVWKFKCDCGNVCYRIPSHLQRNTSHCGCLNEEKHESKVIRALVNTHSEIIANTNAKLLRSTKLSKKNTSGVKGVSWAKKQGKWHAFITFQKKRYHLGYFENKEDAIKARKHAESMMFEPFLEWYEEQKKMKVGE